MKTKTTKSKTKKYTRIKTRKPIKLTTGNKIVIGTLISLLGIAGVSALYKNNSYKPDGKIMLMMRKMGYRRGQPLKENGIIEPINTFGKDVKYDKFDTRGLGFRDNKPRIFINNSNFNETQEKELSPNSIASRKNWYSNFIVSNLDFRVQSFIKDHIKKNTGYFLEVSDVIDKFSKKNKIKPSEIDYIKTLFSARLGSIKNLYGIDCWIDFSYK
jgi:hypothetical protein